MSVNTGTNFRSSCPSSPNRPLNRGISPSWNLSLLKLMSNQIWNRTGWPLTLTNLLVTSSRMTPAAKEQANNSTRWIYCGSLQTRSSGRRRNGTSQYSSGQRTLTITQDSSFSKWSLTILPMGLLNQQTLSAQTRAIKVSSELSSIWNNRMQISTQSTLRQKKHFALLGENPIYFISNLSQISLSVGCRK